MPWEVGVKGAANGYVSSQDLAVALGMLLEDTQHAEHECGEPGCPVQRARATLEAYHSRRPLVFRSSHFAASARVIEPTNEANEQAN